MFLSLMMPCCITTQDMLYRSLRLNVVSVDPVGELIMGSSNAGTGGIILVAIKCYYLKTLLFLLDTFCMGKSCDILCHCPSFGHRFLVYFHCSPYYMFQSSDLFQITLANLLCGSSVQMKSYIWLQTADGSIQQVEQEVAMYCPVICREVLQNSTGSSKNNAVVLPERVNAAVLGLILDFCRFHQVTGRSNKVYFLLPC